MKTLYLLRHAKAEAGDAAISDAERPLAPRGQEDAAHMGQYMHARDYIPRYALVSPAVRTRQTFELAMQAARFKVSTTFEKRIYLASAEDIIDCVQNTEDTADSLLVVGHNPAMHHVAVLLSGHEDTALHDRLVLKYPTGTLTVFQFDTLHWHGVQPGMGRLVDCMSPKGLIASA